MIADQDGFRQWVPPQRAVAADLPASRFIARRGFLVHVLLATAILVGVVASYQTRGDFWVLSYLFLPVGVGGVIFGWKEGLLFAAATVLLVAIPLLMRDVQIGDVVVSSVAPWSFFLVLSAFFCGSIAERGGNARLMAGIGGGAQRAMERERKRVSNDIHDGIAQDAAAALMELEILDSMSESAPSETRKQIGRLKEINSAILVEARGMIGQLRPPSLAPETFESTLSQTVEDFQIRSGTDLEFNIVGDMAEHSDSARICVYRLVQEALANIEQHAQATRVSIEIRVTKRGIHVDIIDNGIGFNVEAPGHGDRKQHLGLEGMNDRVSHLGGRFEVKSGRMQGTVIHAYFPSS